MIALEEQIRRYAVDVTGPAADRAPAELLDTRSHSPRPTRWAYAAALLLLVAGLTVAVTQQDERADPAVSVDATTTVAPAVVSSGPYALPPANANVIAALVDGDLYSIRYTLAQNEFRLDRYAPGSLTPTPPMSPEDFQRFLNPSEQELQVVSPVLGMVYIDCGGVAEGRDDQFDFEGAATAYWLQDAHLMSLSLVGEAPEPAVILPDDGVECPRPADAEVLRQAVLSVTATGRSELDALLDSVPLTIGRFGRAIQQPNSGG